MTALAIPAAPMLPFAPAIQAGVKKIAPVSAKSEVPTGDSPSSAAPFRALMQGASDEAEKPKTKPAKKESAREVAAAPVAATFIEGSKPHTEENKPPLAWVLPRVLPAPEASISQAPAPVSASGYNGEDGDSAKAAASQETSSKAAPLKPVLSNEAPSKVAPKKAPKSAPGESQNSSHGLAQTAVDQSTEAKPIDSSQPPAITDSAFPIAGLAAACDAGAAENSTPAVLLAGAIPPAPMAAQTAKIAFEARLHPVSPNATAVQTAAAQPMPAAAPQPAHDSSPDFESASRSSTPPAGKRNDSQHDQQQPPAKDSIQPAAPISGTETPGEAAAGGGNLAASSIAAPEPSGQIALPANPPPPHAPATPAEPAPSSDPAPAPAPAATDIRISLNDGGQRVELRVTERAGDIHVAVRTPDSQLATAMRDDLPALSSKLEQAGFHSEMGRPAATSGVESKPIQTSSGDAASDSRHESGSSQQRENPQRNPNHPQQTFNRKSDRKEFSWLFESIR